MDPPPPPPPSNDPGTEPGIPKPPSTADVPDLAPESGDDSSLDSAVGVTPGSETPAIEEVARLFPNYEVLALLGHGDLGAVYQARQTSLDRLVVIKIVPLEISANALFADRFRKEARAMARLSHPNIVSAHDFGTTSAGHLFIVMDYVEGPTLYDIIHRPAEVVAGITDPGYFLAPDQALAFVEQICHALDHAHARGIVHRRLKPAKVMIDTEGQVRVTDFGLSPPEGVVDRPGYPAPEQVHGSGADRRTDIYRLGVMLYEMLCREVPAKLFLPPSVRIGCDTRIDAIIRQAIQQTPERRYQSIQEMQSAVAAARAPLPMPETVTTPVPVAPAKSKLPLYATLIVLVAVLAWTFVHFTKPAGTPRLADSPIPSEARSRGAENASSNSIASSGGADADTTGNKTVEKTPERSNEDQDDKSVATGEAPLPADSPDSPQPKNAVEKWLADVDGPRQATFQKLVAEPFTAGVEKLRTRYLAALDAAQAKAAATGSLDQALIWVNERELFDRAQTVRPDDANTPPAIRPLRAEYRQRLAQLESERANRVKPLHTSYDAILLQNLTLLTQRGRIEDAQLLKAKREEIAKAWLETPVTGQLPEAPSVPEAGTAPEALTLLAESAARNPNDTILAMRVAALQVWFRLDVDYAASRERMLKWAAAHTDKAGNAERAGKIACLRPIVEPRVRDAVLDLAKNAVEIGRGETNEPWYQLVLGMAQYRNGNYPSADIALSAAVLTASSVTGDESAQARVENTARFYRAMCLLQQGKPTEARELFTATEAAMTPVPADDETAVIVEAQHDNVILWLAYKEAKALLAE